MVGNSEKVKRKFSDCTWREGDFMSNHSQNGGGGQQSDCLYSVILIKLEFGTKSTKTHVQLMRPRRGGGEKEKKKEVSSWNRLSCVFILLPFKLRVFVLFVFFLLLPCLVTHTTQVEEEEMHLSSRN